MGSRQREMNSALLLIIVSITLGACSVPVHYVDGGTVTLTDSSDLPAKAATISAYDDNDNCMSYFVHKADGVEVNTRRLAIRPGEHRLIVARYQDENEDRGTDYSSGLGSGPGVLLIAPFVIAAEYEHSKICSEERKQSLCLEFDATFSAGELYEIQKGRAGDYVIREETTGNVLTAAIVVGQWSGDASEVDCAGSTN